MMGRAIREDRERPAVYRPIVAIGHTKDLSDTQTVDDFLCFLRAEKITVSTFQNIYPRLVREESALRGSGFAREITHATRDE